MKYTSENEWYSTYLDSMDRPTSIAEALPVLYCFTSLTIHYFSTAKQSSLFQPVCLQQNFLSLGLENGCFKTCIIPLGLKH